MTAISSPVVEDEVTSLVLPSGHVVILDTADKALVEQYRWFIRRNKRKLYVRGYKQRGDHGEGPGTSPRASTHLHQLLLPPPLGMEVDHINGDGLDNRRVNLRVVTHPQNVRNARGTSASGYKGVSWDPVNRKWRAKITTGGRTRCLGRFPDRWEAAQAYNEAALEAWGEFAFLNQRATS